MQKPVLLIILLMTIPLSVVYGEEELQENVQKITLTADNTAYQEGDIITITGKIEKVIQPQEVTIQIISMKETDEQGPIIGIDQGGLYYPTHSTCDIWSEAVQYQASLEADFKRICVQNESLYNLIWHPVKGFRGDKLARFRGIMGMFEDRKIIFNRYRNFTNMFEELTNFGVSGHDDCVDALVWLVTGLMKKGHLQLDF